ncbi:MAG: tetratricopeptide repeat protein, partial [Rubrobacter sp.]|nr:tetratricopeptide repeat protein [Rubrobacter sp.]
MSQVLLRFSIGFVAVALAVAALSLYLSGLQLAEQERLSSTGDLEGAMQSAEMAQRLDPFSAEPLETEAYLLQLQGRNQEAERVFQQAADRAPHEYSIPQQLGGLRLGLMDEPLEAAESYERALELNPRDSISREGVATAYLSAGELEEAKRQYEESRRISGLSAEQAYDLGRIYARTGEAGEGVETLREAQGQAAQELQQMSGQESQQQIQFIQSIELALADAL